MKFFPLHQWAFVLLNILLILIPCTAFSEEVSETNETQLGGRPLGEGLIGGGAPSAANLPTGNPAAENQVKKAENVKKTKKAKTPPVAKNEQELDDKAKQERADQLELMGWVEVACIQPTQQALRARLDSGAKTSSLSAQNITYRAQNGEQWVDFDVLDKTGVVHKYSKAVFRKATIKEHRGEKNSRPVVLLTIQIGNIVQSTEVNLVDRTGLNYPLLLGRRFLADRVMVDSGRSFIQKISCIKN